MLKPGDKVRIKPSVDPNDKRIGTVVLSGNVNTVVNWGNHPQCVMPCCHTQHYTANLELKPFAVGDEVLLMSRKDDKARIVYIMGKQACVHNYDYKGVDEGLLVYELEDISHA